MLYIIYIIFVLILIYISYLLFLKKSKFSRKNNVNDGIIYLIDEDIDTKITIKHLFNPIYSAFEKPFETCANIKNVPSNIHIKLIISTNGGSMSSCEKILKTLKNHKAGYTAYICGECYSAGAIIALGAKEIVMGNLSFIGKMDPQLCDGNTYYSAINFYNLDTKYISDNNIGYVTESINTINYLNDILDYIVNNHNNYNLNTIKENFVFSKYPHCKLFDINQCKNMGLNVREPDQSEIEYITMFDKL